MWRWILYEYTLGPLFSNFSICQWVKLKCYYHLPDGSNISWIFQHLNNKKKHILVTINCDYQCTFWNGECIWLEIVPSWQKNRQVGRQDVSLRPCPAGENRLTEPLLCVIKEVFPGPPFDGLMMERCSFMYHNRQMPADMRASVGKGAWCTLSFSRLTVTPGPPKLLQPVQRLTDLARLVSGGLDWEGRRPC